MLEPRRLIEDHAAPELASALAQARAATGQGERVSRLWQKLGTGASIALPAPPALPLISAAKVITCLGVLALGAAGLAFVAFGGGQAEPVRTAEVQTAAAPAVKIEAPRASPVAPWASTAVIPETAQPKATTSSAALRRPRRLQAALRAEAITAEAGADADLELALLTRAEQALGTQPRAALATLHEHARRFPDGVLAQEREIMSIDAELALGRRQAAAARARAFVARFPGSPHRHRFESMLETPRNAQIEHKSDGQRLPTE